MFDFINSAAIFDIDSETQEALNQIDKKYYTNVNRIYLSPITTNSRGRKQVERMMLGGIDPFNSIKVAAKAAHQALLSEDMNPEMRMVTVDIPEDDIVQYKEINQGAGYRAFVIPADIANQYELKYPTLYIDRGVYELITF